MREPMVPWSDRLAQALARWRVTLGFVFGVLVLGLARPTAASIAAGAGIAMLGEALRFWAAGHLIKSREVTSSGPYRLFAHPLYVGSSVIGVGLAIASGSLVVSIMIVVYLSATLTAAIRTEEAFLRRTFGDGYDTYRRRRGLGIVAAPGSSSRRRFSLERAVGNREHRTAVGFGVAVLLLVLKATYNGVFWRAAAGP